MSPAKPTADIRPASKADMAGVCEIVNHYIRTSTVNFRTEPQSPEEWEGGLQSHNGRYPWLVATVQGVVAGIAYATPWNLRSAYDWCAESTVYVSPGHHRKGMATALYRRLLTMLKAQGFRSAVAVISLPNFPSVRLHESHGFVHTGTLHSVGYKLDRWHDVGLWQLEFTTDRKPPTPIRSTLDVVSPTELRR